MKASNSGGVEVWRCGDVEHRGVEKAGTRTTMDDCVSISEA